MFIFMEWRDYMRPGQVTESNPNLINNYNSHFGKDNWRFIWKVEDKIINKNEAIQIYEEAYMFDSTKKESSWMQLLSVASEVYDNEPSDVLSIFNYDIQNSHVIHLQDIALRRVVHKRGWKFRGDDLIQISKPDTYWGERFSSGKMPFFKPEIIVTPSLTGAWEKNSIEDFYQSNKFLQHKWKV